MASLDFTDALPPHDSESLAGYLAEQGWRAAGDGRWQRGSTYGAWLGFTPKSWPAEVVAKERRLTLTVRAGGQIMTHAEREFWAQEWANLRAAAAGRLTDSAALARRRDISLVENTLVIGLPIPVSIAIGVLVGLLIHPILGLMLFAGIIGTMYAVGLWWLVARR